MLKLQNSQPYDTLLYFAFRQRLLLAAVVGLLVTSLYLGSVPVYTTAEIAPIYMLFMLFVAVKGMENSGFISQLGQSLGSRKYLPARLVVITFGLSVVMTIDVVLVALIPLILSLNIKQRDHLVILVALTAHAGAALMPFGTPQNLFIFSFYNVDTFAFIKTMAPFSFVMLAVFLLYALLMKTTPASQSSAGRALVNGRRAFIYTVLLLWVVLCVLRVLPPALAILAIVYPLLFNRESLHVDYALLATFLCFIGLAGNLADIIGATLEHPHHVFIFSSVMSQFMSNVPTTLLLSNFTDQWKALVWGVNVGGYGSLVAAMANLITYKLYATHSQANDTVAFTIKFVLAGYVVFIIAMGLYFGIYLVW